MVARLDTPELLVIPLLLVTQIHVGLEVYVRIQQINPVLYVLVRICTSVPLAKLIFHVLQTLVKTEQLVRTPLIIQVTPVHVLNSIKDRSAKILNRVKATLV